MFCAGLYINFCVGMNYNYGMGKTIKENKMKKIAFIGAGSLQFTTSCVRDLLCFPAFHECEFALMDVNAENLKKSRQS